MKNILYFPSKRAVPDSYDEIDIFFSEAGRELLGRCDAQIKPITMLDALKLTSKKADLLLVNLDREDVRELVGYLKNRFRRTATQVMGVHGENACWDTVKWFDQTGLFNAYLPSVPLRHYLSPPPTPPFDLFDRVENLLTGKPIPSDILEIDPETCAPELLARLQKKGSHFTQKDPATGRTMTLRLKGAEIG